MAALPETDARAAPFFGRRVVWAAFGLAALGWGVGFYGPPVYLHAVIARTGWSLEFVSGMVTVHFVFGALVVANLPALYGRFGLPAVTSVGSLALAVGVLGWSLAAQPWQLGLAALLTGAGWVTMGAAALNAIVSPWFVRTRSAALSTAYNGASIGGVVFSPLWAALIAKLSFPAAAAIVGVATVCIVWTMSGLVFSRTPGDLGQSPDGDAPGSPASPLASTGARPLPGRLLWRDRTFLTLAAGMALGLFAQIGLIAHLYSVLVPVVGGQVAGFAMALATACAIAGRIVVGRAMPVGAARRLVSCLAYGVQLAGSLVLLAAGGNVALLVLGIVLFGSGIGNATSLPPLIAQQEFAKEDVQRVVSTVVATGQATYAFAPAAFGLLRVFAPEALALAPDSVAPLFAAAAVIQALAILMFLLGRNP
ncbi:MAG TPA: MFS transporter [Beijerinckiaceae bacterium]|jgi:hypothetical protein